MRWLAALAAGGGSLAACFLLGPQVLKANCDSDSKPESLARPVAIPQAKWAAELHHDLPSTGSLHEAIANSRLLVQRTMIEQGIPGAVVAVSKNGRVVWSEGLGYADVENSVPCTSNSVMRIASIAKPLTAVGLLQLWQDGKVDLDASVQEYVPEFPQKTFDGKAVSVTTRQLLSHLAGIRHYDKRGSSKSKKEFDSEEYYIKTHFDSVDKSLSLFASDELLCEPGQKFNYSTHGWTLISAVMEKVTGMSFLTYMEDHVFRPLGMKATCGEFHETLVYNRARHYVRDSSGLLKNVPFVDNSYKWAGGGLISTAEDLLKFGNAILGCYLLHVGPGSVHHPNSDKIGEHEKLLLAPSTAAVMLSPVVEDVSKRDPKLMYSMGWYIRKEDDMKYGEREPFCFGHTGGAVGASSVILVIPQQETAYSKDHGNVPLSGMTVAIIFNLQAVKGMYTLGFEIAKLFL